MYRKPKYLPKIYVQGTEELNKSYKFKGVKICLLLLHNQYVPEMNRSICSEDDLSLAPIDFFTNPLKQCLN